MMKVVFSWSSGKFSAACGPFTWVQIGDAEIITSPEKGICDATGIIAVDEREHMSEEYHQWIITKHIAVPEDQNIKWRECHIVDWE